MEELVNRDEWLQYTNEEVDHYYEIFAKVRELWKFASSFKRLFGEIKNEDTGQDDVDIVSKSFRQPLYINQPFEKISDIIDRCENVHLIRQKLRPGCLEIDIN